MKCRSCGAAVEHTFLDLGHAPPSNAYLTSEDLNRPEKYYPLRVKVCDQCWLVQTEDYAEAQDLFSADYAYFSSTSSSWLAHAADYSWMITQRLNLSRESFVIEIGSNDGYLLKNFVAAGIPCLGIEPTDSTAAAAEELGIPVMREFFGEKLGKQMALTDRQADLILGNNVFAHVPDVNDFVRGLKAALRDGGTITLEFPHLMQLIVHSQFDTIYHEHFSYLSLCAVKRIFEAAQLRIYDVERLPTHGGSLRIYGCHDSEVRDTSPDVEMLLTEEARFGLQNLKTYSTFQAKANRIKDDLLKFLIEQKHAGKSVMAYGAAAKGNTLLNYAGIKPDLVAAVYDAAISKQGKYLPGSHIPIMSPRVFADNPPDYLLVLPWNILPEIIDQNTALTRAGAQFVTAVPQIKIV